MTTMTPMQKHYFDFSTTLSQSRVRGLWKILTGFRLAYLGATIALAISALAKTLTFGLLHYFTDTVLPMGKVAGADMQVLSALQP